MGFLQSVRALGQAQPMTPEKLLAMYPDLFAQQTPAPTQAVDTPVSPIATAPPGTPMPPAYTGPDVELPALEDQQPNMAPEPATVNASEPTSPGPSGPVQATSAPAKRKGLLGFLGDLGGAIGSIIAPEPGSFMDSAYQNTIYGAKRGMLEYQRQEAAKDVAAQEAAVKLRNLKTTGEYKIAGNNIFHIKPDGTTELIAAPVTSETERLIQQWKTTSDPTEKALIERVLRGYQWTDRVIENQGRARTATAVAGAKARGANKAPEPRIPQGWTKEY